MSVCKGGPEPTCRQRPGMGVDVPGDRRPEEPREGAAPSLDPVGSACRQETGIQRPRVSTTHGTRILFQKKTMRSVRGRRPARRCVHPCVGPQRPAVGKAAPCPPLQRSVRASPRAGGPGTLGPGFPVCRGWTAG